MGSLINEYKLNPALGCIELHVIGETKKCLALIDADDWDKVRNHTWHIIKYPLMDGTVRTSFVNNDRERLPRIILGLTDKDPHISFKNGDFLDFRKQNLGLKGKKGASVVKPGKTGVVGVNHYVTAHKIVAIYRKKNGKRASKSYSLNNYNYDEAIKLGRQWREEMIRKDI